VRAEPENADSVFNEDATDNAAGSGFSATRAAGSRSSTELDADESLAEFRELVASAGGQVAAELLQRRARPDPATLIGAGKV
jgi:GTP-binding protein HflX